MILEELRKLDVDGHILGIGRGEEPVLEEKPSDGGGELAELLPYPGGGYPHSHSGAQYAI